MTAGTGDNYFSTEVDLNWADFATNTSFESSSKSRATGVLANGHDAAHEEVLPFICGYRCWSQLLPFTKPGCTSDEHLDNYELKTDICYNRTSVLF